MRVIPFRVFHKHSCFPTNTSHSHYMVHSQNAGASRLFPALHADMSLPTEFLTNGAMCVLGGRRNCSPLAGRPSPALPSLTELIRPLFRLEYSITELCSGEKGSGDAASPCSGEKGGTPADCGVMDCRVNAGAATSLRAWRRTRAASKHSKESLPSTPHCEAARPPLNSCSSRRPSQSSSSPSPEHRRSSFATGGFSAHRTPH